MLLTLILQAVLVASNLQKCKVLEDDKPSGKESQLITVFKKNGGGIINGKRFKDNDVKFELGKKLKRAIKCKKQIENTANGTADSRCLPNISKYSNGEYVLLGRLIGRGRRRKIIMYTELHEIGYNQIQSDSGCLVHIPQVASDENNRKKFGFKKKKTKARQNERVSLAARPLSFLTPFRLECGSLCESVTRSRKAVEIKRLESNSTIKFKMVPLQRWRKDIFSTTTIKVESRKQKNCSKSNLSTDQRKACDKRVVSCKNSGLSIVAQNLFNVSDTNHISCSDAKRKGKCCSVLTKALTPNADDFIADVNEESVGPFVLVIIVVLTLMALLLGVILIYYRSHSRETVPESTTRHLT